MKTTNILAKRAALIAVLLLGGNAWLSAQTNQSLFGRPESGQIRQSEIRTGNISTNSQSSQINTANISTNSQSSQVMKINKGSAIIGATVKNQQGESLGKIHDLVIDFNSGQVAYIVLDSETGMFSASKLHAVPLRAFQPDAAGTSLTLNADKAKLDLSESFAKDNWPAVGTTAWGAEPFWKDAQSPSSSREGRDLYQQNNKAQQNLENTRPITEPKIIEPQPKP